MRLAGLWSCRSARRDVSEKPAGCRRAGANSAAANELHTASTWPRLGLPGWRLAPAGPSVDSPVR